MSTDIRWFTCKCPYCGKTIRGSDDWKTGRICIFGYCGRCDEHIGEDEADWEADK
jgi:hypothetical protein